MAQYQPLYVYFGPILIEFKYKCKKRRCCAWRSNPGPQDGSKSGSIHLNSSSSDVDE